MRRRMRSLLGQALPSEQKHHNDDEQHQAEAAAIIMVRRSIIKAAAAEQKKQNTKRRIIPIAFLPCKPPAGRASGVGPSASRCPFAEKGKRHGGSVALSLLSRAARVWGKPTPQERKLLY